MSDKLPMARRVCKFLAEQCMPMSAPEISAGLGVKRTSPTLSMLVLEFGVVKRVGYRGSYVYSATMSDYERLLDLQSKPAIGPDPRELLGRLAKMHGPARMSDITDQYPDFWPRAVHQRVFRLAKDGYLLRHGKRGNCGYSCTKSDCERLDRWLVEGICEVRSRTQVRRSRANGGEPGIIPRAAQILQLLSQADGLYGAQVLKLFAGASADKRTVDAVRVAVSVLTKAGYLRRVMRGSGYFYSVVDGAIERFASARPRMNNRLLSPSETAEQVCLGRQLSCAGRGGENVSGPRARGRGSRINEMDYPMVVRRAQHEYRVKLPPKAANSVFDFARVVSL